MPLPLPLPIDIVAPADIAVHVRQLSPRGWNLDLELVDRYVGAARARAVHVRLKIDYSGKNDRDHLSGLCPAGPSHYPAGHADQCRRGCWFFAPCLASDTSGLCGSLARVRHVAPVLVPSRASVLYLSACPDLWHVLVLDPVLDPSPTLDPALSRALGLDSLVACPSR